MSFTCGTVVKNPYHWRMFNKRHGMVTLNRRLREKQGISGAKRKNSSPFLTILFNIGCRTNLPALIAHDKMKRICGEDAGIHGTTTHWGGFHDEKISVYSGCAGILCSEFKHVVCLYRRLYRKRSKRRRNVYPRALE